ncbi:hypothetical protein GCM10009682_52490 [Luedemannella flava]|uniref:Molybdopterin oxidoreductase n=1 Tax=Luedemannella flava TaxID=349316 RepID=A0ABP4YT07_9ACTN
MTSTAHFLQGVFPFEGKGMDAPFPLDSGLSYTVPLGMVTQPVYFRGGNTSDDLVYVCLMRDGKPMRYFPIGARGDVHVPLRVVEDVDGGTTLEIFLAAPEGVTGNVVIDLGMVDV